MRARLTLNRVFFASIALLAILLGGLVFMLHQRSVEAVGRSADLLSETAADRVEARVAAYLGQAEAATRELEAKLRSGACPLDDRAAVESCLFAIAAANRHLAEVTFTHAVRTGFDEEGAPRLAPDGRWQLTVFRDPAHADQICTRRTEPRSGRYAELIRCRDPARILLAAPGEETVGDNASDPTDHLTFQTPASRAFGGRVLWSDLSYAERDRGPAEHRRVVVTALQAIEAAGGFAGVARIGLLADQLDAEAGSIRVNRDDHDPFRVFLCDASGRLVTRLSASDRRGESGDDLRIATADVPPMIARAIATPALQEAESAARGQRGRFTMAERPYVVMFRPLAGTQGWFVGVVGPEDYYLSTLRDSLRTLVELAAAVLVLVLAGGLVTLHALRGGLVRITQATDRMRAFDFTPTPPRTWFRDVSAVLGSVEQAKTAMRSMRKYVPIEVVRGLYESNREPVLGGRLEDVSLLFTDVKDFTSVAESMDPDRLAHLLGRYFAVMTQAIEGSDGTVDKYIGDAVMALWNAPRACADHPIQACRAALDCVARTRALFASPDWDGAPVFVTRFGIHRDQVMVGHFGAPERLSYTAIGDGVNVAARLEGLNKQYGTTILVSETIARAAGDHYVFRQIDRVAVKGKSIGLDVFELLGDHDLDPAILDRARSYERALEAYFARDFERALELLAGITDDGPSRVLAERCHVLRRSPPPPTWNGTFVATTK